MNTRIVDAAQPARTADKPLLELRNCTMEFPGVKALDDVSFTLMPGECQDRKSVV